jgi:hypothetical protein
LAPKILDVVLFCLTLSEGWLGYLDPHSRLDHKADSQDIATALIECAPRW